VSSPPQPHRKHELPSSTRYVDARSSKKARFYRVLPTRIEALADGKLRNSVRVRLRPLSLQAIKAEEQALQALGYHVLSYATVDGRGAVIGWTSDHTMVVLSCSPEQLRTWKVLAASLEVNILTLLQQATLLLYERERAALCESSKAFLDPLLRGTIGVSAADDGCSP
jgi:hypothetical protein